MKSLGVIVLAILMCAGARAQTPAAPMRARVTGTVTNVDARSGVITLGTDKGDVTTVTTTDKSFLRRLPPGETDTKKATPIGMADIAAGDRVAAIGQFGVYQRSFEARTVYVMTKADVAQVHAKEEEDWQKRGTTGIVTEVNPAAKTIVIKAGRGQYTVDAGVAAELLRYAKDSAKLADAKPGTLAEIRVGDELHVLGNKSAEGTGIAAEKLVSGSFRQIAATIDVVDVAEGTLRVKDLAAKKAPLLVLKITSDTVIRKLPEQMAAMMARRYNAAAGAGGAAGQGAGRGNGGPGNWPQGGQGAAGAGRANGGPGGWGGRGGGDIKQMLDRLPAVQLADLKRGDAIMVSTTEGTDGTHLTGIMMLAGVEPLLTASPNSTRDIMGGWNLGGGGEGAEGN
ncbi:MAG: hypothetical protein ABSE42_16845 [Bryobacteraceae bacterium]